jgi:hypothetical protein
VPPNQPPNQPAPYAIASIITITTTTPYQRRLSLKSISTSRVKNVETGLRWAPTLILTRQRLLRQNSILLWGAALRSHIRLWGAQPCSRDGARSGARCSLEAGPSFEPLAKAGGLFYFATPVRYAGRAGETPVMVSKNKIVRAELRKMIVYRIKGHRACPKGLDIEIDGSGDQWQATCEAPIGVALSGECYTGSRLFYRFYPFSHAAQIRRSSHLGQPIEHQIDTWTHDGAGGGELVVDFDRKAGVAAIGTRLSLPPTNTGSSIFRCLSSAFRSVTNCRATPL